jgi:hypothetical protein
MSLAGRNQVEVVRAALATRAVATIAKTALLAMLAGVIPLHTAFGHDAIDVDADLFP